MNKNLAKATIIICVIISLTAFAFGISFYFRGLPNAPQPEAGRIYPLNNHGTLLYMTRREQIEQEFSFGVFALLFVIAAFTDHFVDPFDRAKFQRKRTQPWNHRWGP